MSRKDHQYLINRIHEIDDAFSFENLKHIIRKIKYQFWRGRGGGAGKFRGYFFIEEGKKNTVAK